MNPLLFVIVGLLLAIIAMLFLILHVLGDAKPIEWEEEESDINEWCEVCGYNQTCSNCRRSKFELIS